MNDHWVKMPNVLRASVVYEPVVIPITNETLIIDPQSCCSSDVTNDGAHINAKQQKLPCVIPRTATAKIANISS